MQYGYSVFLFHIQSDSIVCSRRHVVVPIQCRHPKPWAHHCLPQTESPRTVTVVRTNRRAIVMMFVRLSLCLGRACIVITPCILARIQVYGSIVQCSGHSDTKACPPTSNRLFPVLHGREVEYDMQVRRSIKR